MEKDYLAPILDEIRNERDYQSKKWGNDADDTKNTPFHWVSYIARYATNWMAGTWAPFPRSTTDAFRIAMIKVATIAVAAVESLDRQRSRNGRAFYEE